MSKKEPAPGEIRAISDDIRDQHKKMKDMSFKERFNYFWYYYKIHTIVIICIIIFAISFISNIVNAKDYSFYGMMLNANSLSAEKLEASFNEYAGLDTEKYECFIDTESTLSYQTMSEFDMATAQRLIALIQTKDLDAVVFDSEIYSNYARNEMFIDLRTIFSPEDIAKYEDYFYYVDQAEITAAQEADAFDVANEATAVEEEITMEDILAEADTHRHPENMEDPIPVGVFLDESTFEIQTNAYSDFIPVYGITVTTLRPATSIKYLDYLWDESIDFTTMRVEF